MIRAIGHFLRTEKMYTVLFLSFALTYAFLMFFASREVPEASPALEKMHALQAQFSDPASRQETVTLFFEENPDAAVISGFGLLFVFGILCVGVCMGIYALFRRLSRKPVIARVYDMTPVAWGLDDVAKVVILFCCISLYVGVAISVLNNFIHLEPYQNVVMIVHTVVTDVVALACVLYCVSCRRKATVGSLGLSARHWGKDIFLGLAGYSVVFPLLIGLLIVASTIASAVQYEPPPHPLVDVFVVEDKENPVLIACSIFLACVVGPIIEEVFFRGFLYNALKKRWGIGVGLVVSAAIFAAIHNSLFAFVPIWGLGFVLALLYEKRGTLIPSITLHVVHNTLFISYFFVLKRLFMDRL